MLTRRLAFECAVYTHVRHVGKGALNNRSRGPELAALYLRVADALERSAQLAEEHAKRDRKSGRRDSAGIELERAQRAHEAALRGRALATRVIDAS